VSAISVAVNLLWLAPGRVGGSEQYLVRQLSGLPVEPDVDVRLMCHPAFIAAHPELVERFSPDVAPLRRDWRAARLLTEHTWLPWHTRSTDVVHHGGGTVPIGAGGKVVLTVHDLQYLVHPEYFSSARRAYLRAMMPRSVRSASIVATPSEYVRGSVISEFGVEPPRVVVVPHGVPRLPIPDQSSIDVVRQRFRLADRPYLVYPAITHPHKGHVMLIDMIAESDSSMMDSSMMDSSMMLVLIGGQGSAHDEVVSAIARRSVADRVVVTGRVNDHVRDALVAGAEALVFASEYEGFGAPLVEAMELGVPIVCGDHPAVREVVGEAGVIVSERTGSAWAAGVATASSRRAQLVAAGHQRRDHFTIERSGAALIDVYRSAANT
jgi:glycosyltransferase involved in cell wall biosynthesis